MTSKGTISNSLELSTLVDLIVQGTARIKPWFHDAIFYCAVPHWFDEAIIHSMRSSGFDQISDQAILDELKKLPFCQEHPIRGWAYHEDIRTYLLSREEVRSQWQELNSRAADTFQKLRQAKDLEGSERFQDSEWRDLTIEWLYHRLNVEPTSALEQVKYICAEALAEWQVDFCAEFLGGLEQRLAREQPNASISDFKTQIDALLIYNNVKALPMLQELVGMSGLTPNQESNLRYWIGTIHLRDEDLLAPAFEELEKARKLDPDWAYIYAAIAEVYYNAIAESYSAPGPTWGQYDLAREYAEKAQALAHKRATQEETTEQVIGYTTLARIYIQLEDWEQAIEQCQKAIEVNDRDTDGYLALSEVYSARNAPNDIKNAIDRLDQAAELDPTSSYYLTIRRGNAYSAARQYQKAIDEYQKAQAEAPDRIDAYIALGGLYLNQGQYTKAEEQYRRVIDLLPDVVDGYRAMAELYVAQEKWERAIELCQTALEKGVQKKKVLYFILSNIYRQLLNDITCKQDCLDRLEQNQNQLRHLDFFEEYTYHCTMGNAYLTQAWKYRWKAEQADFLDHAEKAQRELEQAIEIDQHRAWAYLSLAELAILRQEPARIQHWEQIVQEKTPWAEYDFLASIGEAYRKAFLASEAEAALQRAVNHSPDRTRAWLSLSEFYTWQGKPAEVARVWARLVRLSPAWRYNANLAVGYAYQQVAHFRQARRKYTRALKQEPDRAEAYRYLAELDEADSEWKTAIQHCQALMEKVPDSYWSAFAYAKIAAIYRQQEKYQEAEKATRAAILSDPEQLDGYFEMGRIGAAQYSTTLTQKQLIQEAREGLLRVAPTKLYDFDYTLGDIYYLSDAYSEAKRTYQSCIKQEPNRVDAYIGLARTLIKQPNHNYEDARENLNKAQKIDSTNVGFYDALSQLCHAQKNVPGVESAQHQITRLAPTWQYGALISIGEAYCKAYDLTQQPKYAEQAKQAKQQYEAAIALSPWRPEGYARLASLLTQIGRPEEAEQVYQSVKEAAGISYLNLGWYYEAREEFQDALKIYNLGLQYDASELKPDLYIAAGRLHHQFKQFAESEADYRRAIDLAPGRAEAYVGLKQVLQEQQRIDEAIQICEQMAQQPELAYDAEISRANLLLNQRKYKDSEQAFRRAIEIKPEQTDAYLQMANLYQQWLGRQSDAEQILRQGLEAIPNHPDLSLALAQLREQQERLNEAIDLYRIAADTTKADPVTTASIYEHIGDLLLQQKRYPEALNALQKAREYNPFNARACFSLGNVYEQQGDLAQAEAAYRQALENNPGYGDAYIAIGRLYGQQGQIESLESMADQLLALDPDQQYEALLVMADAYREAGGLDQAQRRYQQAIELKQQRPEAYRGLAQLLEQQGHLDQAVAQYVRLTEVAPKDGNAYFALARLYREQGASEDFAKLIQHIQQLPLEPGENYDARTLIAGIYQDGEDYPQAEAFYRQAIDLDPGRTEAYMSLIQLLVNADRVDEAVAVCEQMAQQPELAYNAKLLQGDLLIFKGEYEEAEDTYQQAIAIAPDQTDAYWRLANAYQQRGKLDDAEQVLRQGLEVIPNHPDFYQALAQLREQQDRWDDAIQMYRAMADLVKTDPVTVSSLYEHIGDLLRQQQRYSEAVDALQQAIEWNPSNTGAFLSLGLVSEQQGDLAESEKERQAYRNRAVEMYLKTTQLNTQSIEAYTALCRVYGKQGRVSDIDRVGRQIMELARDDDAKYDARLAIAEAYQYANLYEWAIDQLNQAVKLNPNRAEAHIGLARLYEAQKQWAKAREEYEKVGQLVPNRADAYLELGRVNVELNQWEEAESALRQAINLAPDQLGIAPNAYLFLADLYRMQGRHSEMQEVCGCVIALVQGAESPDYNLLRQQGLAYFMRGDYADAEQALNQALESNPADAQTRFYLALDLLCLGRQDQAKAELQRGIDSTPNQWNYNYAIREAEILAARTPEVPGSKEMLQTLIAARDTSAPASGAGLQRDESQQVSSTGIPGDENVAIPVLEPSASDL